MRLTAITLTTVAAVLVLGVPLTAKARQARTTPSIGVLVGGSATSVSEPLEALRQGLAQFGYSEAQGTVQLNYRYAEGRLERLRPLAEELVQSKVDLIFVGGDQAITAAKQVTSSVPIVMVACDAVAAGIVTNLARPGGNVTGVTCINSDLAAKRLEILRETLPKLARVGVILNPEDRRMRSELSETEAAGRTLGISIQPIPLARLEDFGPAFAAAIAERTEALVVVFDALTFFHRRRLAELAVAHRLPTIHNFKGYVEAGGLLSYGPSLPEMWRRATAHVDKILKGARPGDLPVEQPTKFELVVNHKTAKALSLPIPRALLLRADQVIQ